jgi:2-polyprenyl-6-hydroxyphenyl methylase/3-demethylubiquinone-9 3-methyltransferase
VKGRLHTRAVHGDDGIRAFFDAIASSYGERHGAAERLLERRLRLIRRLIGAHAGEVLLDLGCGPGVHLFPLAPGFRRAIGVDLSPQMIAAARRVQAARHDLAHVELHAGDARKLAFLDPRSVDVALCTGALEHVPDKPAVLAELDRVLKPGGRFVCLTVNADHVWHRLGPQLGYELAHLSTDAFLGAAEMRDLIVRAGLEPRELGYWHFVARGDMPPLAGHALELLDFVGRAVAPHRLRGGLYACALKPV